MYCNYCGKQIADDSVYCQYCGKATDIQQSDDELASLVALARNGNQKAIAALYEKTYSKVFYTVKSMIKDEDDVFDILQDSYIKAFSHLDKFQGDTKFLPWVKQIAANTARDWLKKKKPMLFSDMATDDEQDSPIEEQFVDERSDSIPEQVIDQNETARLIREIIEDLPEDQRAVIGMFYYEELSVREIAAAMGTSESAVKSRLLYGRKKIEAKVLELEKKGTKLYGLAPIPFLLLLFRNQSARAAELPNGQILQNMLRTSSNIVKSSTASSAAGAGSSTAAGTGASAASTAGSVAAAGKTTGIVGSVLSSLGAAKIAMLGIGAAAVVGAGFVGTSAVESHLAESQRIEAEAENPDGGTADLETESDTPDVEEPSPTDDALEQYHSFISQADSYDYNSYGEATVYRYALVQMQQNNSVPALLMEQLDSEDSGYILVFQYDPETKTVHQSTDYLTEYFGGPLIEDYYLSGNGHGLMSSEVSRGNGDVTIYRTTLVGNSLKRDVARKGNMADTTYAGIDRIEIDWHDIGDTAALDNWTAPEPADATQPEPSGTEDTLPTDGNRIVLTGTVGAYSYTELAALQGISESELQWIGVDRRKTYRVIVLDTPQTLELITVDRELFRNEVTMIEVFGMEQYDGQHVIFSIDPRKTEWPSEAALPLGQPSTQDIHILN